MGFLDELKRRLMQQEGQHPPLVMNDPGISGRDTRPSDVITGIPQQPTPNPTPQVPITRPRAVMDNVRTAVAQPQPPVQQVQQPVAQPVATMRNDTPEATRDRRTQPRDYVADDEAYLRDLRNKPRNWKDKVVDALDAVNAGVGGQRRILPTKREREIGETEGRLGEGLKIQGERARIRAADASQIYRQQQQDEREINNALTQFNRLEHFDPDNPADAGFAQYFRDRGLTLPKKDKYHRPIASWVNGKLVLTDSAGTREADIDGQPVVDQGRIPNEQGLTPNQAAIQTNNQAGREQRGQIFTKGEEGRNRRFNQGQQGLNQRSAAGIAARGQGGQRVTTDKTALRRAAQLAGQIEAVRKDLEAYDARTPANERNEVIRKQKADKAAAAITELNNLGAGYEAGMGTGGYPYQKQTQQGTSDLDQPIVGVPKQGRTIEGAIQAFQKSQKRQPTADEIARMKAALGQ